LKSIQQRRVGGGAPARINYEELLSKQANPSTYNDELIVIPMKKK